MSEIEQERTERVQEAPVSQLVLEKKFVRRSKADTTPSVLNVEKVLFHNTAPVLVTRFNDVQPGQEITMLGDGFTTIEFNAKQKPTSGANTLLVAGKVYRYTDFGGVLYEDAGGAGGGGAGPAGARGPAGAILPPRDPEAPAEPMVIPGRPGTKGNTGAAGRNAPFVLPLDGRDADPPMVIPGRDGKAGGAGIAGVAGKAAQVIPAFDGRDGESPMVIPGRDGKAGIAGGAGAAGKSPPVIPPLDPREPDLPMVIPGRDGKAGAAGGGGTDPVQQSFAPGSFLVPTGKFVIMSRRLALTGAQRLTLQGNATLSIYGRSP